MGNETSFTPGSWFMNVWTTGRRTVECRTGLVLAEVHVTHEAPEQDANARLMAAAPDLYDALRRMERLVTELYPGDVEPDTAHIDEYKAVWSVVMDARTALAKAVTNG